MRSSRHQPVRGLEFGPHLHEAGLGPALERDDRLRRRPAAAAARTASAQAAVRRVVERVVLEPARTKRPGGRARRLRHARPPRTGYSSLISRSITSPCGWRSRVPGHRAPRGCGQDGRWRWPAASCWRRRRSGHGLPVDLREHVEAPQAALGSRAARVDLADDRAGGAARQFEPTRDVGRDVVERDAEARRLLDGAFLFRRAPASASRSSSPMVTLSDVLLRVAHAP